MLYNQRLYEIIYVLLSNPKVTCDELAGYFGVSRHTIMRDMDMLTAAGVPIFLEKGRSGGIHLFEKPPRQGEALSAADKQAITASLQGLSMLSRETGKGLLEKLEALLKQSGSGMLCMDYSNWRDEARDEDRFGRIQEAILGQRMIAFAYIDTYGKDNQESIEPQLLWLENGYWYLRGYSPARQKERLYKVVRMNHIVLGEGFDGKNRLKDRKAKWQEAGTIELRLWISGGRRERVYDEFCESEIAEKADGSFEVTAAYPEGQWLYDFLLSFGKDLEVIEPVEVRAKLGGLCQQVSALYQ